MKLNPTWSGRVTEPLLTVTEPLLTAQEHETAAAEHSQLVCLWAMFRRPVYLLMAASALTICRRSMASHATVSTRYAVQLLPPQQGPVLGVGNSGDKASAVSSYEVLQEPAGAPFDGLQVRRTYHISTAVRFLHGTMVAVDFPAHCIGPATFVILAVPVRERFLICNINFVRSQRDMVHDTYIRAEKLCRFAPAVAMRVEVRC